ncbi:MAG: NAD(+)/NADH kinase [Desulfovibrionaceae bacterium]
MNAVLIVSKEGNSEARELAAELSVYLEEKSCHTVCCEHRTSASGAAAASGEPPFDLIVVLGGDGTLISAARRLFTLGVPLVGLNLGQVGFLAELSRRNWREGLEHFLQGEFTISRRMMLSYDVLRDGAKVVHGHAVNDIVISRGALARLIRLGVRFDGLDVTSMRSDGLIISTPTGSTAYSVSAGGPLVYPETMAYGVTPICPFLNGFKPLVLPADKPLEVLVQEEKCSDVCLTEDGQEVVALRSGDIIRIERSGQDLLLGQTGRVTFFNRLIGKGFLKGG